MDTFSVITDFKCPKKTPTMRYLLALLALGSARLTASDDLRFLECIAQIESAGNDNAVGRCGGLGRYQLSASVWHDRAPKNWPHEYAHSAAKSQYVAMLHLTWLRKQLDADGSGSSYERLAYAWLRGAHYSVTDTTQDRWTERLDYGARVMRLFKEKQ
jgi:hypothetical protein